MTGGIDISKYQDEEVMKAVLNSAKTIAVVGLSDNPERSSHSVSEYMQRYFRIIPVNPGLKEVLGERCYPSLNDIPEDISIDIVNVFRRSEFALEIAEQAARIGANCLWLQQGVVSIEAAEYAESKGMGIVMDACIAVVHATLGRGADEGSR